VFSLDYSNAVDACLDNHGLHPNLHLVQGDIYRLPYEPESFDNVFCFGVLQHTPDVKASFMALASRVRQGGDIAVDVYPKTWQALLHYPRYLLRPIAKRLAPQTLYAIVVKAVALLLPLSVALKAVPFLGRYLFPLVPVANYWRDLPLPWGMLKEWSIIDTFDWLASWYDQPQDSATLAAWMREGGFVDCDIRRLGSFVGTGKKKQDD
jgi:SAM-dependent methyltransferase